MQQVFTASGRVRVNELVKQFGELVVVNVGSQLFYLLRFYSCCALFCQLKRRGDGVELVQPGSSPREGATSSGGSDGGRPGGTSWALPGVRAGRAPRVVMALHRLTPSRSSHQWVAVRGKAHP